MKLDTIILHAGTVVMYDKTAQVLNETVEAKFVYLLTDCEAGTLSIVEWAEASDGTAVVFERAAERP